MRGVGICTTSSMDICRAAKENVGQDARPVRGDRFFTTRFVQLRRPSSTRERMGRCVIITKRTPIERPPEAIEACIENHLRSKERLNKNVFRKVQGTL